MPHRRWRNPAPDAARPSGAPAVRLRRAKCRHARALTATVLAPRDPSHRPPPCRRLRGRQPWRSSRNSVPALRESASTRLPGLPQILAASPTPPALRPPASIRWRRQTAVCSRNAPSPSGTAAFRRPDLARIVGAETASGPYGRHRTTTYWSVPRRRAVQPGRARRDRGWPRTPRPPLPGSIPFVPAPVARARSTRGRPRRFARRWRHRTGIRVARAKWPGKGWYREPSPAPGPHPCQRPTRGGRSKFPALLLFRTALPPVPEPRWNPGEPPSLRSSLNGFAGPCRRPNPAFASTPEAARTPAGTARPLPAILPSYPRPPATIRTDRPRHPPAWIGCATRATRKRTATASAGKAVCRSAESPRTPASPRVRRHPAPAIPDPPVGRIAIDWPRTAPADLHSAADMPALCGWRDSGIPAYPGRRR